MRGRERKMPKHMRDNAAPWQVLIPGRKGKEAAGAMVAAGSLVTPNKRVKSGELWGGSPAKFLRPLTPEEQAFIMISADNYVRLGAEYLGESPVEITA